MAFFSFNLKTGTGPFTIVVREATETRNRYISGTIPGVIEYEEIPDNLPHDYIVSITSPSCEPFEGKFTFKADCKAKPTLNLSQDCVAFPSTGKVYLNINSSLEGFSNVLIQAYSGSTSIFAGIIDSNVVKSLEVTNNKEVRVRASNPLYSTCFTEVNYTPVCKVDDVCEFDLSVGAVTPDTVVSYTPIPNISSAKVNGNQVTIIGTSVCNGTVRLYKRSGTSFNPITERTIPVTNGEWSYTFTGTTGTYAADAYCSNYTNPSQLSFGFDSVIVPVEPDPEPVNAVISRAAIDYFPGGNTFLTAQVDPFAVVEAQLTSPNNSTAWLDVTDWGSTVGGKTYNTRLVLPNFPAGTYTVKLRVKGKTDVITVNNVSISAQGAYSFYPVVVPPDPEQPTDPEDLTIPTDVRTDIPSELIYLKTDTAEFGVSIQWGGGIVGAWFLGTRNTSVDFLNDVNNLVNNADYGRQMQYAYYSWPVNDDEFRPGGQKAFYPQWKSMGWDPIQVGDCCAPSRVSQWKLYEGGKKLYVRNYPKHWGYCNSEAQCYVDTFYIIDGKAIRQYNILVNQRTDYFRNLPRGQDLGGGFFRGDYFTATTYMGNKPWTGQQPITYDISNPPLNQVEYNNSTAAGSVGYCGSENWTALSSATQGPNKCIGMWSPTTYFANSIVGEKGKVELPKGGSCTTIGNHIFLEKLDRNIVYKTEVAYVFGSIEDIRTYAQSRRADTFKMDWDFSKDRQHWWTQGAYENGQETQYPFPGYWEIKYDYELSNFCSVEGAFNIADYNRIDFEIAVTGNSSNKCAFNMHKKLDNGKRFNDAFEDCAYDFPTINDGQFHKYTVDLTKNPKWTTGTILRMYVDFGGTVEAGRWVRFKQIKAYKV